MFSFFKLSIWTIDQVLCSFFIFGIRSLEFLWAHIILDWSPKFGNPFVDLFLLVFIPSFIFLTEKIKNIFGGLFDHQVRNRIIKWR